MLPYNEARLRITRQPEVFRGGLVLRGFEIVEAGSQDMRYVLSQLLQAGPLEVNYLFLRGEANRRLAVNEVITVQYTNARGWALEDMAIEAVISVGVHPVEVYGDGFIVEGFEVVLPPPGTTDEALARAIEELLRSRIYIYTRLEYNQRIYTADQLRIFLDTNVTPPRWRLKEVTLSTNVRFTRPF